MFSSMLSYWFWIQNQFALDQKIYTEFYYWIKSSKYISYHFRINYANAHQNTRTMTHNTTQSANPWSEFKQKSETVVTFFPRMTAPGSPWMTMYLVPPIYNPVGASDPGSLKSLLMAVISSGLNWIKINTLEQIKKNKKQIRYHCCWQVAST